MSAEPPGGAGRGAEPGPKVPRPGPHESDAERRRRLIANEVLLRRMNGRLEELNRVALMVEEAPQAEQAQFLCECSRAECRERLDIDVATYARLHAVPDRHVVVAGHETAEIERVVARRTDWLVVEKL